MENKKLIDLNYAMHQLELGELEQGGNFETDSYHIKEFLSVLPIVDAVEVVRCMYCTKAKNSEYNRIVWCTEHQCRKLYVDFCSKGDRTHEPVYMRSAKMDGDNE